jgi:hypothetical protein
MSIDYACSLHLYIKSTVSTEVKHKVINFIETVLENTYVSSSNFKISQFTNYHNDLQDYEYWATNYTGYNKKSSIEEGLIQIDKEKSGKIHEVVGILEKNYQLTGQGFFNKPDLDIIKEYIKLNELVGYSEQYLSLPSNQDLDTLLEEISKEIKSYASCPTDVLICFEFYNMDYEVHGDEDLI